MLKRRECWALWHLPKHRLWPRTLIPSTLIRTYSSRRRTRTKLHLWHLIPGVSPEGYQAKQYKRPWGSQGEQGYLNNKHTTPTIHKYNECHFGPCMGLKSGLKKVQITNFLPALWTCRTITFLITFYRKERLESRKNHSKRLSPVMIFWGRGLLQWHQDHPLIQGCIYRHQQLSRSTGSNARRHINIRYR